MIGLITSYFKNLILISSQKINLKLIKCDFWLDFILFHFFKEIIKIVFLYSILYALLKFFLEIWSMKKKKEKEKCSKNIIIFSSNLNRIFCLENVEIWFSLFL